MCVEIYDRASKTLCTCPRELAALIGPENIVWSADYGGLPNLHDAQWMDGCLCPVDRAETLARVGGIDHGIEDGFVNEVTFSPSSPTP